MQDRNEETHKEISNPKKLGKLDSKKTKSY